MKTATLTRTKTSDQGTFGTMVINEHSYVSGELPWRDNHNELSCIPVGMYTCTWRFSNHFQKNLYHVENVKGRDGVLIHPAHLMGDTTKGLKSELLGCIALGKVKGIINAQEAVLQSKAAIDEFNEYLNGQPVELVIVEKYG